MWDVFISHASEDKELVAKPLAEELRKRGLRIWYDEFTIELGDSLRRSIDAGLARSRFGVIILSPSFFAKQWPQRELDGLSSREISGEKVILPVWHGLTFAQVAAWSPMLADRLAVSTDTGVVAVADAIEQVVRRSHRGGGEISPPGDHRSDSQNGGPSARGTPPSPARSRTRRRLLFASGVVGLLLIGFFVLVSTRRDRSVEHTGTPVQSTPDRAQSASALIEHFHAERNLGWANFYIGMSYKDAEFYAGILRVNTEPPELSDGPTCTSDLVYDGVRITFDYEVRGGQLDCSNHDQLYIQAMFIYFTPVETALPKSEIVRLLKVRIPQLRYTPSPHAAGTTEAANDSPLYTLGELGDYAILIKPEEQVFILASLGFFE